MCVSFQIIESTFLQVKTRSLLSTPEKMTRIEPGQKPSVKEEQHKDILPSLRRLENLVAETVVATEDSRKIPKDDATTLINDVHCETPAVSHVHVCAKTPIKESKAKRKLFLESPSFKRDVYLETKDTEEEHEKYLLLNFIISYLG